MPSRDRRRVLFVATHPVQYSVPLFRRMAADPRFEIQVAFLTLAGATPAHDPGFGTTFQWDLPLLDGYPWVELARPRGTAVRRLIDGTEWDAVVLHTGYRHRVFWSAVLHARRRGCPVLFGTDATGFDTQARPRGGWKGTLKRLVLPWIFRLADVAIVPSSRSRDFLLGMGIAAERVVVTPYVVDNDWWTAAASAADRAAVRRAWNVPLDATVFLFCAKLQPWKRPQDLLTAFAGADAPNAFAMFAGEGPLRSDLERAAAALGVEARTRFLGFVNQSRLPSVYRASDVLVLPSGYEPFGVVVNEAMLCGCAVVASDAVGAAGDLLSESGVVYPAGAVEVLGKAIEHLARDGSFLEALRAAGAEKVSAWSPELNIERLLEAVDRARRRCARSRDEDTDS
jgi:glycosyltransferase involved in cell wall biosynthesis